MSMEDWDFGYYGKGLDGYVHFRQGIKEIESHAPYSKCRHGRRMTASMISMTLKNTTIRRMTYFTSRRRKRRSAARSL